MREAYADGYEAGFRAAQREMRSAIQHMGELTPFRAHPEWLRWVQQSPGE